MTTFERVRVGALTVLLAPVLLLHSSPGVLVAPIGELFLAAGE